MAATRRSARLTKTKCPPATPPTKVSKPKTPKKPKTPTQAKPTKKVAPKPSTKAAPNKSSSAAPPAKPSPSTVQFVAVPNKPDHYTMTYENGTIFELKKAGENVGSGKNILECHIPICETSGGASYAIEIYLLGKDEEGNITSLEQYVPEFTEGQKGSIERMRMAMKGRGCEHCEVQEGEEEEREAEGEEEEVKEEDVEE